MPEAVTDPLGLVGKVLKGHSAAGWPGPESCLPGSLAVWPWVSDSVSLVLVPVSVQQEGGWIHL